MKELNIDEIKQVELDLLRKFKEICEKNNFTYYLFFGTLIGCIRHKGFIPWDDDIDVVMPRDDYEKFIKYCLKNKNKIYPYNVVHYRTKKKYAIVIAKLENKGYMLYGKDGCSCEIGINIDIYPLDGVGNTSNDIQDATDAVKKWNSYSKYFKNHAFRQSNNKWINRLRYCFYLIYEKIFDIWVASLDKKVKKKKIKDYKYVGIPCWQPDNESYFDKALLEIEYGEFEGDIYVIPKGYDTILRQIYGNYMMPPNKEALNKTHVEKAIKL